MYEKGKDRSVSRRQYYSLSSSSLPIYRRERDIKRNLMMQLTVRRTKNDVFVTTTARNNDESVYCMLSLSLSLSLSLIYHRIDVRWRLTFIRTLTSLSFFLSLLSFVHHIKVLNLFFFSINFIDKRQQNGSLNNFNW